MKKKQKGKKMGKKIVKSTKAHVYAAQYDHTKVAKFGGVGNAKGGK